MSEPATASAYINESILMWQESDCAEVDKLREALAHATEPLRTVIAQHVKWEQGTKLWLLTTATKQQYAHLNFWLCGYAWTRARSPTAHLRYE